MMTISAEPSSSSLRPVRLPAHRAAMEWLGAESAMEKASLTSKGQDSSTRAPSVMSGLGSSSAADDVSTVLGSVDFRDQTKIQEGQGTEIGSHMDSLEGEWSGITRCFMQWLSECDFQLDIEETTAGWLRTGRR